MTDQELDGRCHALMAVIGRLESHGVPGPIAGVLFVDCSDLMTALRRERALADELAADLRALRKSLGWQTESFTLGRHRAARQPHTTGGS